MAAARGAWAVGSGMVLIARIIRTIAGLIAALIVVAILLRVLGANAGNSIVKDIHDAAKFFVGPFDGMFSVKDAKLALAVNWGIAALVYAVVGGIIASFIARLAPVRGAPARTSRLTQEPARGARARSDACPGRGSPGVSGSDVARERS